LHIIAQGFGFTRDFLEEWNNSAYCRLKKIPCGFKEQARARHPGEKCGPAPTGFSIGWVVNAIGCGNIFNQKWINTLETSNINTVLMRMRTTLVMGVNATNGTKIVLRLFAIKLIKL
jgi:hypothetical protein